MKWGTPSPSPDRRIGPVVIDSATNAVAEYGWQQATTGTPGRHAVTTRAVERAVAVGFGRLRLFGALHRSHQPGDQAVTLTDEGACSAARVRS